MSCGGSQKESTAERDSSAEKAEILETFFQFRLHHFVRHWRSHILGKLRVFREFHLVEKRTLDYLHRGSSFTDLRKFSFPGLILLDLELPKPDGHGVLRALTATHT